MAGYVYIFSNDSMPGLLKIGHTLKTPTERAKELSSTASPTPFVVEYSLLVDDPEKIEQQIHNYFLKYRVSENREFFKIDLSAAIQSIEEGFDIKQNTINRQTAIIDELTETLEIIVSDAKKQIDDLISILDSRSKSLSVLKIVNQTNIDKRLSLLQKLIKSDRGIFSNKTDDRTKLEKILISELKSYDKKSWGKFKKNEVLSKIDEMLNISRESPIAEHYVFMAEINDRFKIELPDEDAT